MLGRKVATTFRTSITLHAGVFHMVDETEPKTEPLADPVEPEKVIDEPQTSDPDPAATRLRAYEDEVLGEDVPRISGHIERGVGSKYQGMSDEQKRKHTALERLTQAEKNLAHAEAAVEKAKTEHESAAAAVDQAAGHVDGGEDAATG